MKMKAERSVVLLALSVTLLAAGCGHATPVGPAPLPPPIPPETIVAMPDRTEADLKLDAGRKPAELLAFLDISPGMKVAELFAGGGYTTELLARAVGPNGVVYGQNTRFVLQRFAEKPWSQRLTRPVNRNVVRVDRELDDPLPPEAKDLDLVVSNIIYHDTVWQKVDRPKMNAAVFAALKHGGRYVVCDSSAQPGSGTTAAESLHRIDELVVRQEVPAVGFKLVEQGSFLRNPEDKRDWNSSPMAAGAKRGTSDRFCLAFAKP